MHIQAEQFAALLPLSDSMYYAVPSTISAQNPYVTAQPVSSQLSLYYPNGICDINYRIMHIQAYVCITGNHLRLHISEHSQYLHYLFWTGTQPSVTYKPTTSLRQWEGYFVPSTASCIPTKS